MGAGQEVSAPAYADASALVKLIVQEAESRELAKALRGERRVLSSEIAAVELDCAAHRRGVDPSVVEAALGLVALMPLDAAILRRARRRFARPLRALDAVHLATALALGSDLGAIYVYDAELAQAAVEEGLRVSAPA